MGNCFSRINKGYLFDFEKIMKNSKGKARLFFDVATRGTYTGVHSIKKLPEIMTLPKLETGVW